MKGGRGGMLYCAILWAVMGGEGGGQTKRVNPNHTIIVWYILK